MKDRISVSDSDSLFFIVVESIFTIFLYEYLFSCRRIDSSRAHRVNVVLGAAFHEEDLRLGGIVRVVDVILETLGDLADLVHDMAAGQRHAPEPVLVADDLGGKRKVETFVVELAEVHVH